MKNIFNKKAFTLVEVLAVIVILGIIASITIPTIGNVIEDSEKRTFKTSANGLLEAAKQYYLTSKLENDYFKTIKFEVQGNEMVSGDKKLAFSGKAPVGASYVEISNNGEILLNITDGTYYASKDYDEVGILIGKENEDALTRDELTAKIAQLEELLNETKDVLNDKIDSMNNLESVNNLKNRLDDHDDLLDDYSKKIQNNSTLMTNIVSATNNYGTDINNNKNNITNLTTNINTHDIDINTNKSNISSLTSKVNTYKTDITNLINTTNTHNTDITNLIASSNAHGSVISNMINVSSSTNVFLKTYPIGSIYISVSSANPGTLFGGTWERYGNGRTLVGVSESEADFNTVNKIGGAKTHSHAAGNLYAAIGSPSGNADALGFTSIGWHGQNSTYSLSSSDGHDNAFGHPTRSHDTLVGGETSAASTLQPYITTYMWRRTA